VRLDVLNGGMPNKLVPGSVSYYPKLRISGNRLIGVSSVRAPLRVFRFTLQGIIQSIVGLSHHYSRLFNQLAMISLNDGTM
jgi:hypothetical protein